jgi:hypothetical protein
VQREEMEEFVRRRVFQPFAIYLTDGTRYEVRHPWLVMTGRRSLTLGLTANPAQTYYDGATHIDLFHIVRVEMLDPQSQSTNGSAS